MLPLFRYSLLALFLSPFQTTFVHVRLSLDNNLGRETRVAEKSGRQSFFYFGFPPSDGQAKQFYRFSIVSSNRGPRPSPSTKVVLKFRVGARGWIG